jgi:hypothetical protein
MISNLESDCAPPRNVNDAEINVLMKKLPSSQPITVFTDSSFLFVSARSISIRKNICALANSLQSRLSFQDTLAHVEALQGCLELIPTWTNSRCLQARTLLNLQLLQLVVILHATKVVETEVKTSGKRRYSMISLLDAATTTVNLHTALTASSYLALCCTRSDSYKAALLICHVAYYASKNNGKLHRMQNDYITN